jgi:tetratricopeptide (TPR) repeat protein
MTLMSLRRLRFLVLPCAAVALTGCAWLQPVAHFAANAFSYHPSGVRPLDTKLTPVGPTTLQDRLYAEAVTALEKREYGQALEILQVAREAKQNDARVLNALGVLYDKLGRFDVSGHFYDLAEKADPGSRVVAINRRYSQLLQLGLAGPSATVTTVRDRPAAPEPQTAQVIDQHPKGGPT